MGSETEASAVTSVTDWKKSSKKASRPLPLPSGKTCLVSAPGLDSFVRRGMIPNALMGVVSRALQGADTSVEEMTDIAQDPKQLTAMFELIDTITCDVVIEPKVWPVPPNDDRSDEKLYVDEVDLNDKMFIFQFVVGGTRDLESFREQLDANVQAVSGSKDVELPTK